MSQELHNIYRLLETSRCYAAMIYGYYNSYLVTAKGPSSYGLDGPGIESRWGARFSAPVQTNPDAHPASYAVGTGYFPGGKAVGA